MVGLIDELVPHGVEIPEVSRNLILGFVRRLSLTMAAQLQEILLRSVCIYRQIWDNYYSSRVVEATPKGQKETKKSVKPQIKEKSSTLVPMFVIKLMLIVDHFEYLPTLADVSETVIKIIDKMVEVMQGIDDLESRLEDLFRNLSTKKMAAIAKGHPIVVATKSAIQVSLYYLITFPELMNMWILQ